MRYDHGPPCGQLMPTVRLNCPELIQVGEQRYQLFNSPFFCAAHCSMNPHYHTAGWPVSWAKLGQLLLVLYTLSRLGQLVLVHSFMIITTVSNTGCIFSYGFRHVRQIHVLCVALSDLMPALSEATQCLNQGLLPCGGGVCSCQCTHLPVQRGRTHSCMRPTCTATW